MRWALLVALLACWAGAGVRARRVVKAAGDGGAAPPAQADTDLTLPRRLGSAAVLTDDHRISELPGLDSKGAPSHYAGHILVDPARNGHIFYWLVEAAEDPANRPLVIWLNGGPGCSSMDGMWLELGPFRLADDGRTVRLNPHSWHNAANLLFIDQPVGTGFSFVTNSDGYAKNDDQVNEHMTTFLSKFFKKYPTFVAERNGLRTTRSLFFTGESHAGHFIPSLVAHLLKLSAGLEGGVMPAVVGIALGNPWFDPAAQYNPGDFAHGLGLLSKGQANRLKQQEAACQQMLSKGIFHHNACLDLLDNVVDGASLSGADKLLMYDARQYMHNPKTFPPGHDRLESYLNRADVRAAIHAGLTPHRFQECTDPPYFALVHQDGKGVTRELVELLHANVRVLIYSGQFDLVCNHLGTEAALNNLDWEGRGEWTKAPSGVWLVDRKPVGYLRSFKNLQSLLVLDAGHMVPMDAPAVSLMMISAFLQSRPLQDGPSRVGVADSFLPLCRKETKQSRWLQEATSAASPVTPTAPSTHVPLIAHMQPMADRVIMRLRLQQVQHGAMGAAVVVERAAVRVEPGGVLLPLGDALFNSSHAHVDVAVTGLTPGQEYTFTMEATLSEARGPAMKRPHKVTVGCFREGFAQCCHHGVCVSGKAAGTTICSCDAGYHGDSCNSYLLVAQGSAAGNHSVSHGDSVQCAIKSLDVGSTITWSVTRGAAAPESHHSSPASPPKPSTQSHKPLPSPAVPRECAAEGTAPCCAAVEISLLGSTSTSESIVEHRLELAALLEHDFQAALVTSQTGQVTVRVQDIRTVRGEMRPLVVFCSTTSGVAAALQELHAQATNPASALRRGMVSDRLNPQHLEVFAHTDTFDSLLPDPTTRRFLESPWFAIGAVGALATLLICLCSRPAPAHDRLPTSARH